MSGVPKTDAELLQCAPQVDPAQFPKAINNRITQGYGEYCMQQEIKCTQYNIYFYPEKDFKRPVDCSIFWSITSNFPGRLFKSIYFSLENFFKRPVGCY